MTFDFKNKEDLKNIIDSLDLAIEAGRLSIDDIASGPENYIYINSQPESVNRFFEQNCVKIIEILNLISDPIFIKDDHFRWLFVNDAFCSFFGINHHDILQKTSMYLFPKNQSDIFEREDKKVLETGKDSFLEEEITDSDGVVKIILSKKKLFKGKNNRSYIIGSFYDITDHRNNENSIRQINTVLESQIKERTQILTQTINKLQEEINQRRISEMSMLESEEKFRNVIEQSLEGIALENIEGKIIEWNRCMHEITGISREQAIGMYIWDIEYMLVVPENKKTELHKKFKMEGLDILLNKRIKPEKRITEFQIRVTDGSRKFINLTTFEINTNKEFYIGRIVRDISAQKKISESLARSENQYKAIFQHANDAILLLNPENLDIVNANEKASEIYNYSLKELTEMNLAQLSKNLSYDHIQIKSLKNQKVLKNFETIHLSKKGKDIHVLVNGSLVEYGSQQVIMNIYNDITELKQSEKARTATFKISQLIHTATRLDDLYEPVRNIIGELMDATNFYIALFDEETNILSFPYFVDDKDPYPQPRPASNGLTEYVIRNGKPLLLNYEQLKELEQQKVAVKMGAESFFWVGVPLITQKKVIGVIVLQSHSKKISFTIRDKDILVFISEQIAILIYKKLAEENILNAKEKAEESDRLKTAFIANMSHELRTPMTGIIGFTSILASKITDPEIKNMLEYILISSNRLMSTLNSILELSQLEAGKKPLDINKADINILLEMTIKPFIEQAEKKKLKIIKNTQPGIVASFNDNFFIQILSNLISNAIKFTDAGSIEISNGVKIDEEENFAFISVQDTGIGIEEKNFKVIFEDFRQVSEGMNRKYEGSGLGLSLCKKMAEMMGGKIQVQSILGSGSTFTLFLPYTGILTPDIKPVYTDSKTKEQEKTFTDKPKVLVVDDNKINAELLAAYISNEYEVQITTSGEMAFELIRHESFSAVLMDIQLGEGLSGVETTNKIREIGINIPIIAVTAYSTEQEMEENFAGYFTDYLLKPIDRTSLVKKLKQTVLV